MSVALSAGARGLVEDAVTAYAARRPGWSGRLAGRAELLEAEVLRPGRPGVLDVVARIGDELVHVPLGLRAPGDDASFLAEGEDPVLGIVEDADGPGVAYDALRDGETAAFVLEAVAGQRVAPGLVRTMRIDDAAVTLAMEDRLALTVFNRLVRGPRPSTEIVIALDEAGFNHLAAPMALWRRGDLDLGIVQEHLPGASTGWALALTSVRDLYASGGPPELAGGDFGGEAHRLGTMAARMHLALAHAFGRRPADLGAWARAVETSLAERSPRRAERPDVQALLDELRRLPAGGVAVRTHGDFHLGRVWRTEQGWYVGDFSPGGRPPADGGPEPPVQLDEDGTVLRSPLADVADMLWSFGYVATSAAAERDPTGREGLVELAEAWEQRNRRALLAGYLGVPGMATLVPPGRDAVRVLVGALELERAARAEG
jgi:maltokinase